MSGGEKETNTGADVLRLDGIVKRFGGEAALNGVTFSVRAGEVHALVGENGAGKSTLVNIATGVHRPDEGQVFIDGDARRLQTPHDAARAGIAVVHQEAELFPQLSLAENMLLEGGLARKAGGFVSWPSVNDEAKRLVASMGESFDVRQPASQLSIGRRMIAEIAVAVDRNARVLFLDEPTAALTQFEAEKLFEQVRRLRDAGVGIVYVSHRLAEVMDLADRITVLRDGATVTSAPKSEMTIETIVAAMVGREVSLTRHVAEGDRQTAPCLKIENLSTSDGSVNDVSLYADGGEVVGIYGFVGAGRSELGQALFGLRSIREGSVVIENTAADVSSPQSAMAAGIAYVPEDRLVQGVFRTHSVRANSTVATLKKIANWSWIPQRMEAERSNALLKQTDVRAASPELPMDALSGGNQQKVILGRWLATDPTVWILDEPTRGVDVGAKASIHEIIRERAADGMAVVAISSDLPEVMAISDRIYTMANGRITGEFDGATATEEDLAAAAVPESEPRASEENASALRTLLRFREIGLFVALVVMAGTMAIWRPAEFATLDNFLDVLANASLPAIVALGALLVICAGGIDISVGSMMGLAAALAAMAAKSNAPPVMCLAIAVALGASMGAANAGISLLGRIHPIVVTLAGISIYRGLMRVSMQGREIMDLPVAYRALADGTILGVPKICYYLLFAAVAVHIFLNYRITGRRILALGNSETAARLIGLSKAKLYLTAFTIAGALVGLAAVLHTGYYGKVQANTGAGWELQAIAATVIGGTNITGGRGTALGTVLGAFLVALLSNVLILAQVSSYWQQFFVGVLILAAVLGDAALQRRTGQSE